MEIWVFLHLIDVDIKVDIKNLLALDWLHLVISPRLKNELMFFRDDQQSSSHGKTPACGTGTGCRVTGRSSIL